VLTLVVGLIGLALLPGGIHYGWLMVTGRLASTNYPGAILAIPAELLVLPVAILSIWKQEFGGTLAVIVGIAGFAGALATRCGWQAANRRGLAEWAIAFLVTTAVGWLLVEDAKYLGNVWLKI
jgi:hypothetical protein